jgi:prophage regulatory protein
MDASILRLPDVRKRVGLSKSQIYLLIARGEFPRQLRLSARASGWDARAVAAWIESRKVAA